MEELTWRKSSWSNDSGSCVEVAEAGDAVAVRDSTDPAGGLIAVPPPSFRAFVQEIKAGTYATG